MRLALMLAAAVALVAAAPAGTVPVTRTATGSFVLGNPAAATRVVEYLSYSCPHCAHFVAEGWPQLKVNYVARGTVAVELRHAVRDRYDLAAALLARCRGTATFEGDSGALFAAQPTLMARAAKFEASAADAKAPLVARLTGIARASGMLALMQGRGLAPARAQACLANTAEHRALLAMTAEAQARAIPYTPALYVGTTLAGSSYDDLVKLLPPPR